MHPATLLALLWLAAENPAAEHLRVISLDDAIATAQSNHPEIRQIKARAAAAAARSDEAFSALLPQLSGNALYQRATANYAPRPGSFPKQFASLLTTNSWDTANFWNFGLTVNQLVFDFGSTYQQWNAS